MKMGFRKLDVGRGFLVRAKYDSEIINFVTELAKENGIMTAIFMAIGALKCAKLGFYDQEKHEYLETPILAPQEIASCVGNISIKEGEIFVHAHAVLADINGNTKAGHLLEGKVFAAEIYLTELVGEKLVRKNDAVTGLSLWDI
jgi:predicted DNA-binding protein with PD1-like motif